jgi:hypothetical protein
MDVTVSIGFYTVIARAKPEAKQTKQSKAPSLRAVSEAIYTVESCKVYKVIK